MKIEKYKKLRNGKYEITLEDNSKLELYEDVILKYRLLLTKEIENNKKEILEFNQECDTYNTGLKYLKNRARSKKEILDNLIKKEYPQEFVEKAITKLEQQGYINDEIYSKSFLNNKLITTSNGPYKIKQEMFKKGIDKDIIEKTLEEYTSDIQKEKINKIVTRMIKANRNKGNILLKKKIYINLINDGFEKGIINDILEKQEFKSDEDIAKKEYEKLYKKLSKKYEGNELEYKIRQKLYQKGLIYEE